MSLDQLVSAIFALPDTLAAEDGIADYRRASKRAKLTADVEDVSTFRNVRLSRDSQNATAVQEAGKRNSEQMTTFDGYRDMFKYFDEMNRKFIRDYSPYPTFLPTLPGNGLKPEELKVISSDQTLAPKSTNQTPPEFNDALSYIGKVKDRLQSQPSIYKAVLELIASYQRHEIATPEEVLQEVEVLFSGTPDLIESFQQFLPKAALRRAYVDLITSKDTDEGSDGRKRKRD
jgi:histone deacetylase complex regulatory component SIN3